MTETFICKTHHIEVPASGHGCEQCYTEWEHRRPANEMTPDERVSELKRITAQLSIPMRETMVRVDELVGRSVYSHELGSAFFDLLCEEARNPTGYISDETVIARAELSGKPVVVVRKTSLRP